MLLTAIAITYLPAYLLTNVSFVDRSAPVSTPSLLDWPTVHRNMQWSVVLLLGGGLALAYACKVST